MPDYHPPLPPINIIWTGPMAEGPAEYRHDLMGVLTLAEFENPVNLFVDDKEYAKYVAAIPAKYKQKITVCSIEKFLENTDFSKYEDGKQLKEYAQNLLSLKQQFSKLAEGDPQNKKKYNVFFKEFFQLFLLRIGNCYAGDSNVLRPSDSQKKALPHFYDAYMPMLPNGRKDVWLMYAPAHSEKVKTAFSNFMQIPADKPYRGQIVSVTKDAGFKTWDAVFASNNGLEELHVPKLGINKHYFHSWNNSENRYNPMIDVWIDYDDTTRLKQYFKHNKKAVGQGKVHTILGKNDPDRNGEEIIHATPLSQAIRKNRMRCFKIILALDPPLFLAEGYSYEPGKPPKLFSIYKFVKSKEEYQNFVPLIEKHLLRKRDEVEESDLQRRMAKLGLNPREIQGISLSTKRLLAMPACIMSSAILDEFNRINPRFLRYIIAYLETQTDLRKLQLLCYDYDKLNCLKKTREDILDGLKHRKGLMAFLLSEKSANDQIFIDAMIFNFEREEWMTRGAEVNIEIVATKITSFETEYYSLPNEKTTRPQLYKQLLDSASVKSLHQEFPKKNIEKFLRKHFEEMNDVLLRSICADGCRGNFFYILTRCLEEKFSISKFIKYLNERVLESDCYCPVKTPRIITSAAYSYRARMQQARKHAEYLRSLFPDHCALFPSAPKKSLIEDQIKIIELTDDSSDTVSEEPEVYELPRKILK